MSKNIVENIISLARNKGIGFLLQEDKLRLRIPKGTDIDQTLLDLIKSHRDEIVLFLRDHNVQSAGGNSHGKIAKTDRKSLSNIPLSFSQERLWFIDQLQGSIQYHLPSLWKIKGNLNREALQYALGQIVDRHEILRTVYDQEDGRPYQRILSKNRFQLGYIENAASSYDTAASAAFLHELISRPFDLRNDHMLRADLVGLTGEEHLLVIVLHHIASDGWSLPIIVHELKELYTAYIRHQQPDLLPLPVQYADYSIWQREYYRGQILDEKLEYWKDRLQGLLPLELPADYPASSEQHTRGAAFEFTINKPLTEQLQKLSLQQGCTMFMTFLAACKVLLNRYSSQEDICISSPIANRQQQEVEGLIGFFVNMLPLRTDLADNPPFIGLLQRVKTTVLKAYDHQEAPFEKVVESTVRQRNGESNPLSRFVFVWQNNARTEIPETTLPGLQLSREFVTHTTSLFDLQLSLTEKTAGIEGIIEYNTGLYKASTIKRLVDHFLCLLEAIVTDPSGRIGSFPMLSSYEEHRLLEEFNDTATPFPGDKTIVDLFAEQMVRTPDAVAVVAEEERLSYRDLHEITNRLGHYLRAKGLKAESLVPICIHRSTEMIIGIIGILKAGCAYVPVDPEYPDPRIRYILEDTAADLVLTHSSCSGRISSTEGITIIELDSVLKELAKHPATDLPVRPSPHSLAYTIYTSGSTGQPKGVLVEHRAIVNRLYWAQAYFHLTSGDSILQKTTFCFDVSVWELLWPLLTGSKLVFARPGGHTDNAYLRSVIEEQHITVVHFVPSMLEVFLADLQPGECKGLEKVLCSGERLNTSQVRLFKTKLPHTELHNLYGPTEAAVDVTYWTTPDDLRDIPEIPIGRPVYNTGIFILSNANSLLPQGGIGELHIGGEQLARGYLNRPELTNERFIPYLFGTLPARTLYKTGDLARWLPDGNIEYLGRKDDQVKIRGFRVELGETETVLRESGLVNAAVVAAKPDASGTWILVGYIVPRGQGPADKRAIMAYLKARLPEYMVPALLIELTRIPLTANGKTDKKALPAPALFGLSPHTYRPPQNAIEHKLVIIWQELLGLEPIGIQDDFFELGGHSLLAMRMVSGIRKTFGVEVRVKDLFLNPDIRLLSEFIGSLSPGRQLPPVELKPRPERIPLSFSQERLWFLDRLEGSVQYHSPIVLRLLGEPDIDALEYALQQVVNRHEALRTVFDQYDGFPCQRILDKDSFQLGIIDREDGDGPLQLLVRELINRPFDLHEDHMLRADMIRLAPDENMLVVTLHHIASDGWSLPVLVRELEAFYTTHSAGRATQLPPLPIQFADFAIWQREYLQGEILEEKLHYWKHKLNGILPMDMPADHPRPAVQSRRGGACFFNVNKELTGRLRQLSRQQGCTLFMTLLAAFKVLLHRYSGQTDICIGSPVANRQQQDLEGLIGFFVNLLPLRSDLAGNHSFIDLLQQVKITILEAYEHQDTPFEKIVEAVVRERDLSRTPLFQVIFYTQDNRKAPGQAEWGALKLSAEPFAQGTTKFDLVFLVTERTDDLEISIEYCVDLYLDETISRLGRHFAQLLNAVAIAPSARIGEYKILDASEEKILLEGFNDTAASYPKDRTVLDLFEAQVTRTPDNTALLFEGRKCTYRELNEQANRLAHYLRSGGVREESLVAVCLERSIDLIIGLLAIWKAGCAYVPVDPEYPGERINNMLEDMAATVVLSRTAYRPKLEIKEGVCFIAVDGNAEEIALESGSSVKGELRTDQVAYVIYTSGSTGRPKGVVVEHRSVMNLIHWHLERYKVSAASRATSGSGVGFDAIGWEIWPYLSTGASVCLLNDDTRISAEDFFHKLRSEEITHAFIPTAMVAEFIRVQAGQPLALQYLLTGGDQLGAVDTKGLGYSLVNNYGPTENTVVTTSYELKEERTADLPFIGTPIFNTSVFIAKGDRELCGIGLLGELYIGGEGLARGYLNRPELTAEKFIDNPFKGTAGSKVYKTGDIGRWRNDGSLEYTGRLDEQVKIRGYRVEPGEIENILRQSGLVSAALVLAVLDRTGTKRLVGYVVPKGIFDKDAIIGYLKGKLPEYMIPFLWVELDHIPLNANGKIDKKSLADIALADLPSDSWLAPRNETESAIAAIWEDLLQVSHVGTGDDFFELGGYSLLAIRIISAIRRQLGIELTVKDLFSHPTVGQLARHVRGQAKGPSLPAINPEPRPQHIPLSFAQERLWLIDQWKGTADYHLPSVLSMKGELDIAALQYAFQNIVNRHEVLRTTFLKEDGRPRQQVMEKDKFRLGILTDVYGGTAKDLREYIDSLIQKPFDLKEDHMLRADLIRLGHTDFLLVITIHHIAFDGWSLPIITKELKELYESYIEGRPAQLKPLPVQYADYALWQRRHLDKNVLNKQLQYWKSSLIDVPALNIPADHPRPAQQGGRGATIYFSIDPGLKEGLQQLSRQQGATLFMTLLAAFKVLLFRYSGQNDICIGTPVAGRQQDQIEDLVGFFINMLALRTDLSSNPLFTGLLQQVKRTTLEAYDHQEVPFERVVESVVKERDLSRPPLFQVMFILQNHSAAIDYSVNLKGVGLSELPSPYHTSKFDLTLSLAETREGLSGSIEYNTDLYEEETMIRLATHYERLLHAIVHNPEQRIGELEMLHKEEKEELLSGFNDTRMQYPGDKTIIDLFEEQVSRTPDDIAVIFEDRKFTYRELDERSDRLASYLRQKGVREEVLVPVCLERSADLVLGILGILKAGGAYVPLDPEYPEERKRYMLDDTDARFILTSSALRSAIPLKGEIESIERPAPDQLAYVIYTSGSTGRPKGVMIEHRSLTNFIFGMNKVLPLDHNDHLLAITSASFDISILELFWTLCNGVTITIKGNSRTPNNFNRYAHTQTGKMDFSLFYFASPGNANERSKYDFLLRSTAFADKNHFSGIWLPERHFHEFGGIFPNPAVLGAAIAATTKNIEIRSGSVVLPLNDVIRVAEEWSIVDNLSDGRVSLSLASGWHADDFVLMPENYAARHKTMYRQILELKELWRGGTIRRKNGVDKEIDVRIFPRPVTPELPVWITSAGNPETFESAGKTGANILTHLLGQDITELGKNITAYKKALIRNGYPDKERRIAVMLHTYIGEDMVKVRAEVNEPFKAYLRSSVDLIRKLTGSKNVQAGHISDKAMEELLETAFERYWQSAALLGTKESCMTLVEELYSIGVTEIACLIDFGVDNAKVLDSLSYLNDLRKTFEKKNSTSQNTYKPVSALQITPSYLSALISDKDSALFLRDLKCLIIGGENLPDELTGRLPGKTNALLYNVYGPTETTIWSTSKRIDFNGGITVGRPLANTSIFILDENHNPCPVGVPGELYIGGHGLSRGYLNRPELTAERFIQNPLSANAAEKIYRTGDLARWRRNGDIEILGRSDDQVKLRGYRIEPGEIQHAIDRCQGVLRSLVITREDANGDKILVAYVQPGKGFSREKMMDELKKELPAFMIPQIIVELDNFPLNGNGKIDKKSLPPPFFIQKTVHHGHEGPEDKLEKKLVTIWALVLGMDKEQISIDQNFFEIGGNSLKIIQLANDIGKMLNQEIDLQILFQRTNIRSFAAYLRQEQKTPNIEENSFDQAQLIEELDRFNVG